MMVCLTNLPGGGGGEEEEWEIGGEGGGVVDIFIKGGAPNLEAKLAEVQKGHYMGQLVVPPQGEVGGFLGPTLYVPRPNKLKKKENILAGGAGGDGGVGMGRRGNECKSG